MTSVASLRRMSAKTLSQQILEAQNAADPTFAVIDVRDDGECSAVPLMAFQPCFSLKHACEHTFPISRQAPSLPFTPCLRVIDLSDFYSLWTS